MSEKVKIAKILKSKAFKISLIVVLSLSAISALSGSIYISFQKNQAKHTRPRINTNVTKINSIETEKKYIPLDRSKYKTVPISDFGSINPFNPTQTLEVPRTSLNPTKGLSLPPQGDLQDTEAGMVLSTTISGIMYDEYNPSAIINIEGLEYFVKNNDTVNNYKILSISPRQVIIKHGKNIYKAGVGELLTEVESNSNIVNLNKKFGGNIQDSISIKVRKN